MGEMEETRRLTFESAMVGEIVCLNHWPYKPFKIMFINRADGLIGVESYGDGVRAFKPFKDKEFDAYGYYSMVRQVTG